MTGLGQHCAYLPWELLGFRRFKVLLWGKKYSRMCQIQGGYMYFWHSNEMTQQYKWIFKRLSSLQLLQKKVIKPYIKKKEQALVDAAFYVLFSARQATLQKITVLLTQAKRGLQARARKKCQTKGIYLVTCLLPFITQHYCLCSVQPQLRTPWIKCGTNRRSEKTSNEGRSEAPWGWLDYSCKKDYLVVVVNVK